LKVKITKIFAKKKRIQSSHIATKMSIKSESEHNSPQGIGSPFSGVQKEMKQRVPSPLFLFFYNIILTYI